MIKIKDVEVMGMRKAIKGMRNRFNSWDNSDSIWCGNCPNTKNEGLCIDIETGRICNGFIIGKKDIKLYQRIIKAGVFDRKSILDMIHVQADVIAPLYWWKEYTYNVETNGNSCITMHTIHNEEFTRANFSYDHIPLGSDNFVLYEDLSKEPMFFLLNREDEIWLNAEDILDLTIKALNHYREKYIETQDKKYWDVMIQLLPSSFNQMRTIDLSYETLLSMYHDRKNNRLDEWKEFCKWIETLPYMKEFLGLVENN